jgi:hypothetical protein
MIDHSAAGGTFAAVGFTLWVLHSVSDHWIQTSAQAAAKGSSGWRGWAADTRHVATLTLAQLLSLIVVAAALHLHLRPAAIAAGLTVNALTHWYADRAADSWRADRPDPTPRTLARVAELTGNGGFWRNGLPQKPGDVATLGSGAYALDQSWHHFWLAVAALLITTL